MLIDDLSRDRLLWLAVVVQAIEDLSFEPYHSLEFDAAYAFFTHDGQWQAARGAIADMIGWHPDDIRRAGLAHLAVRERREPRCGGKRSFATDFAPVAEDA